MPRDTFLDYASIPAHDKKEPFLDSAKIFAGIIGVVLLASFMISTLSALPQVPADVLIRALELANG